MFYDSVVINLKMELNVEGFLLNHHVSILDCL